MDYQVTVPAQLIAAASFTQAKKDTRYYLNGIHFVCQHDKLEIVATDGKRMTVIKTDIEVNETIKFIISLNPDQLRAVRKRSNHSDMVTLDFLGLTFSLAGTTSTLELVDGAYPDYQRVMVDQPSENHPNVPCLLDASYLGDCAKIETALTLGKCPCIDMRFCEYQRAHISYPNTDIDIQTVVMGIRPAKKDSK